MVVHHLLLPFAAAASIAAAEFVTIPSAEAGGFNQIYRGYQHTGTHVPHHIPHFNQTYHYAVRHQRP